MLGEQLEMGTAVLFRLPSPLPLAQLSRYDQSRPLCQISCVDWFGSWGRCKSLPLETTLTCWRARPCLLLCGSNKLTQPRDSGCASTRLAFTRPSNRAPQTSSSTGWPTPTLVLPCMRRYVVKLCLQGNNGVVSHWLCAGGVSLSIFR